MTSEEFIFEYLKADQDTGAGSYEKMVSLIKELDWNPVKTYILKLKYFYFLRTSYWLIISNEVKRRANWRCSCGRRESLQVHHGDEGNKHHGEEHLLLLEGVDVLKCLCGKCHQKIHGNETSVKDAEKKRQRDRRKEQILSQLDYYPSRVAEIDISGSSFVLTRKLLEELEHERKVTIERTVYEGWKIHRT
jgi:hypothetical protein